MNRLSHTYSVFLAFVFCCASIQCVGFAFAQTQTRIAPSSNAAQTPLRAVWIPQPKHTDFWRSPDDMTRHLKSLNDAGINTLCVVVWNQGRTFFRSKSLKNLIGHEVDERFVSPTLTRDPLAEVIAAAKPYNMRVYAWFEFGFATDVNNGTGREIVAARPHWQALKADGKPLIRNGFRWMNAFDPEVQDFMLALMMEVVEGYEVTGIQGDDRLPAFPGEGGYNDNVKAMYAKAHNGKAPPNDHKDAAWVQWRADRMGEFQARVYREAKMRKPNVEVTLAPPVFPWSRDDWLMDWPRWFETGIVDRVFPQVYRKDVASYQAEIDKIVQRQVPTRLLDRVHPGLLTRLSDGYAAPMSLIEAQVAVNRRAGIAGEAYFFNEGVMRDIEGYKKMYRPELKGEHEKNR
jgi:uncharacterized lipoprotein YddW (UPF0748 family)